MNVNLFQNRKRSARDLSGLHGARDKCADLHFPKRFLTHGSILLSTMKAAGLEYCEQKL